MERDRTPSTAEGYLGTRFAIALFARRGCSVEGSTSAFVRRIIHHFLASVYPQICPAEYPFRWEIVQGTNRTTMKWSCYETAPHELGLEDSNTEFQPVSTSAAP